METKTLPFYYCVIDGFVREMAKHLSFCIIPKEINLICTKYLDDSHEWNLSKSSDIKIVNSTEVYKVFDYNFKSTITFGINLKNQNIIRDAKKYICTVQTPLWSHKMASFGVVSIPLQQISYEGNVKQRLCIEFYPSQQEQNVQVRAPLPTGMVLDWNATPNNQINKNTTFSIEVDLRNYNIHCLMDNRHFINNTKLLNILKMESASELRIMVRLREKGSNIKIIESKFYK